MQILKWQQIIMIDQTFYMHCLKLFKISQTGMSLIQKNQKYIYIV